MGIKRGSRHRALVDYGRAQSRAGQAQGDAPMQRDGSRILLVLIAIVAAALLWISLPVPRMG